jgi:hypothetical protein
MNVLQGLYFYKVVLLVPCAVLFVVLVVILIVLVVQKSKHKTVIVILCRACIDNRVPKARFAAPVAQVRKQSNITPISRLTLAKAQLVLDQRGEATTNVKSVLKAQLKLKVDPNLRALVEDQLYQSEEFSTQH